MNAEIDITPAQRKSILALLCQHIPGVLVWAYGSRVKWTARPSSDLDLVAFSKPSLNGQVAALKEAFEESDLPFPIDLFVWDKVPINFRSSIEKDHVVLQEAEEIKINPTANSDGHGWLYRPEFPDDWQRKPLYSLARWVNGLPFREIQFSPVGKPIIKIAEIKGGITVQTKFTTQTFDESVSVKRGDLLFTWSGQPETSIDTFWWQGLDGWLNQHIFKVTPQNAIDPVFFFYILRYLKPNFIAIARNKQTTGLGHVTKRDLENIVVAYPVIEDQRAIAHVLGKLDDKIELNRRMNTTLEDMAQATFKKFFPYSTDDDLPKGWRVSTIGEAVRVVGGSTPSTTNPEFWDGGTNSWVTPKDLAPLTSPVLLDSERKITDAGVQQVSSGMLPVGTVLLSSRAPIGYLAITEIPVAVNQGFIAMVCDQALPNHYIHLWTKQNMEAIKGRANGTTFMEISKSSFRPLPVVVPPKSALDGFEQLVEPLHKRVVSNLRESRTLAALRDALLPKLLSGHLTINKTTI